MCILSGLYVIHLNFIIVKFPPFRMFLWHNTKFIVPPPPRETLNVDIVIKMQTHAVDPIRSSWCFRWCVLK